MVFPVSHLTALSRPAVSQLPLVCKQQRAVKKKKGPKKISFPARERFYHCRKSHVRSGRVLIIAFEAENSVEYLMSVKFFPQPLLLNYSKSS